MFRRQFVAGQGSIGKEIGINVAFDMIDAIERLFMSDGQGARGKYADEQAAAEAWSLGYGNAVDVAPGAVGGFQGLMNNRQNGLDMAAGGDFRYHAPVSRMQIHAGSHGVREQPMPVFYDGCGRLIATGFDAQDFHPIRIARRL